MGMQQAIGNRVFPFYGYHLKQRMDVIPYLNRHQHIIAVFTAVKYIHTVKIKIHDLDLTVILPDIVPKSVHVMAPVTMHQHQIFPVQILYVQLLLSASR